ncbi:YbgA family protein [Alteromonas sp. a30]|uniref:YbgA family protein n=1 Tax=Alteromonas sp. a30 TaxID=2730917 RepID=UPI00228207B0|nr:DUF1722 domain-containing protein [Alteromonas sp. a30]MCY7296380.1 DUF523 and DUF1722 domain-containing protein [Alteromonas sp. a30]
MIKIGVSSCVVGSKVRYDGGHKRSSFVATTVSDIFQMVPFCPEVGMGMSVPRPTIHIRDFTNGDNGDLRLVDSKDGSIDHTPKMAVYFSKIESQIQELDGYIVAAKSPSCGMERIKVFNKQGDMMHRKGQGLFVSHLKRAFPNLPIEEDGRLNDQGLKDSFFARVTAHHRFRKMVLEEPSVNSLVQFHSQFKFLVLAHKPDIYRLMGRVVANAKSQGLESSIKEYFTLMMSALSKASTRKTHTNVLMHLQGFLKKSLTKDEKQELCEQIELYRTGLVPLLAPLTLLRHHLKRHPNQYLENQAYMHPYPLELGIMS